MKVFSLVFLLCELVAVQVLLTKATDYVRVRAEADHKEKQFAEAISKSVENIISGNQSLKALRVACATSAYSAAAALKASAEIVLLTQNSELAQIEMQCLVHAATCSQTSRAPSGPCSIPGDLSWHESNQIAKTQHEFSGAKVYIEGSSVAWHFEHPAVRAL